MSRETMLHILPTSAAVDAFNRRDIAAEGVLLGLRAMTLKRLTEEIAACSPRLKRPVSPVGRRLLLEAVVKDFYGKRSGNFSNVAEYRGFLRALEGFCTELKQSLITPEEFGSLVRRLPGAERLRELADLAVAWQKALAEKGMAEQADLETTALEHLRRSGELPQAFKGVSGVTLSGIYDFSPLQLQLIAELSRRLPVRIVFPYHPEREEIYAYVSRNVEAFEALDDGELALELEFAEPDAPFTVSLQAAPDGVVGEVPPAPLVGLSLFAAPGAYRECEEIGRRIRLLLEQGVPPEGIAVAFRDQRSFGPMMEDVCRRFRIPVSYRRGAPLWTSPLARTLMSPFAIVRSRFGREELLDLVKSTYFAPLFAGNSPPSAPDEVEDVLVAASYIDETLGRVESRLERHIRRRKKEERSTLREERVLHALSPLMKELRLFSGRKTVREFTELLERFIERHGFYRRALERGDDRSLRRDASAIMEFREALSGLERDLNALGMADTPMEPDEFASLLQQGMEDEFLAGTRGSGVTILNFHDARGLTYPHLFIGGLNEGICPSRHTGHPLFRDREKQLLNKVTGRRIFRTAAEKALEEPLLFWLAIGCAQESLTLSWSHTDSRGNQQLASPFVDEILERFQLKPEILPVGRLVPEMPLCMERDELLHALAAFNLDDGTVLPIESLREIAESVGRIRGTADIEAARDRFYCEEDSALRSTLSFDHTGRLEREDIRAELKAWFESPEGNEFAPTLLEEFGRCPFSYFLRRVLGIRPMEEPGIELEMTEKGSLVHEVLRTFFARMKEEGRLPLRGGDDELQTLRAVAAEVFAAWEEARPVGEPLLWELEKGKLLAILERMAAHEGEERSRLVPELFEAPFERLEVANGEGAGIFLRGKIDRVDVALGDGALRVVDYKLGGNEQRYRELLKPDNMGRVSFQLPVYLLAAMERFDPQGGWQQASARYWLLRRGTPLDREFLGDRELRDFLSDDPEVRREAGDDNFLNRVCATVEAMKRGDFQVTPRECEFCGFSAICRYVEVELRGE
ncbi:MAG: PD-(D/E)XK nuclease family protein [Geobacter sp.]|nr:PD-(D/E)XK nuclease family protein [Geobacter sp.]